MHHVKPPKGSDPTKPKMYCGHCGKEKEVAKDICKACNKYPTPLFPTKGERQFFEDQ